MSNLKNFSAEEVKGHISGKFELYDSAIRNGYYLPKYKSGIITENYLTNVILGEIFCPKFSDIKLLQCPSPPDKETIIFGSTTSSHPLARHLALVMMTIPPTRIGW